MTARLPNPSSEGNPPSQPDPEISRHSREMGGLLSARSAAILGASFLIAVAAGILAYFTLGRFPESLAGAALAAGAAFAGTIRLLMSIIA